jgi:hypothetical protein
VFTWHGSRALAATALLLTVAGCGGSTPRSATATPSLTPPASATATATATTSPTPAPDIEQVAIVSSGFGAYDLQVYPIAVLHNLASAHTASQVIVSFTVDLASGSYQLSAEPVSLAPGETLGVTVLCTDKCDGATGIEAATKVGSWVAGGRSVITAGAASWTCGSPCHGSRGYQGDVTGTLSGDVPAGMLVGFSAVCVNSGGTIVGGGLLPSVWPDASAASPSVPTLVTSQPASCQLYGTEVS